MTNCRTFKASIARRHTSQVDQGNRGYYPSGMGSAKNPFAQEDRKEAFNAYGMSPFYPESRTIHRKEPLLHPACICIHAERVASPGRHRLALLIETGAWQALRLNLMM